MEPSILIPSSFNLRFVWVKPSREAGEYNETTELQITIITLSSIPVIMLNVYMHVYLSKQFCVVVKNSQ